MEFKSGYKYGLVGINGSGKTTIIKLLLKLYEPTGGQILINGINLKDIDLESYYPLIATMFQEINIFKIPIKNNISLTNDVDVEKVYNCLKKVGLLAKIKSLPNGIDTEFSREFDENGVELSAGEIQKILIARAIYKEKAKLIIFDEPTASLDPFSEIEIFQLLNSLKNSATISIVISHRMASMKDCNYIFVLSDGKIVESGTFEFLLGENGKFSELYNLQKRNYIK